MSWAWSTHLPAFDAADRAAIERELKAAVKDARFVRQVARGFRGPVVRAPEWPGIAAWTQGRRRAVAMVLHTWVNDNRGPYYYYGTEAIVELAREGPWCRRDLLWALDVAKDLSGGHDMSHLTLPLLIMEKLDNADLAGCEAILAALAHDSYEHPGSASLELSRQRFRRFAACLDRVTGQHMPSWILHGMDSFGQAVRREHSDLLADPAVADLLVHCMTLEKPTPTGKWLRRADELVRHSPRVAEAIPSIVDQFINHYDGVRDDHDTLLRGLVWVAGLTDGDRATDLVAACTTAAAAAARDTPKYPYAPKAAAAGVEVLAGRSGDAPARTLARLSVTVKSRPLKARVNAALEKIASSRGWALGEVLELAVDDHGLDSAGRHVTKIGDYVAIIEITDGKPKLTFERDGKVLKSVPAAVKDGDPDLLKALRLAVKDIGRSLASERTRLDSLFSEDRDWAYADWAARYLDHPITGQFGQSMIWIVDGVAGLPRRDGAVWVVVDRSGADHRGERVRLWHPAAVPAEEVGAWREHLIATGHRQAIKQAFREVYLLTPAELTTNRYSNRYAGHILNYRQAGALMGVRGWQGQYLGFWDGGYNGESSKEFGGGQWRATFFYDLVENRGENDWQARYCSTDQVRFSRKDGRVWTEIAMAEVPPLVFTEAMRDVDLFVGVTSIAADASWVDRGEDRFQAYWHATTFGDLTASGEVRRDVLARILPRLRIAESAELTERFLRVRGKVRTYKIHLGSGNILMEPNDTYLCIVADRAKQPSLHLPFDDDAVLSMILSTALLLAADDKIVDPTITRQLKS